MTAQLLAVLVCVTPSAKKHLNGSLWVFWKTDDDYVHHQCIDFRGHGGYGHTGFQLCDFFDWEAMFLNYWRSKAALTKGCEWANLQEVRQLVIEQAVTAMRLWNMEITTRDCLVRFDAVRIVDPFYVHVNQLERRNERFDDWYWKMIRVGQFVSKVSSAEWAGTVRPILAEMPVLPFVYRCLGAREQGYAWERSRRVRRLDVKLRRHAVKDSLKRFLRDRFFTEEWAKVLKQMGWFEAQSVKRDAEVKAVRRAQRRGKVSSVAARGWFKKFHAISLLGGWARREEEARKQSTNKEAIS